MKRLISSALALLATGCAVAVAAPISTTAPSATAVPANPQRALFDMGPAYLGGPLPGADILAPPPPAPGSPAMARDTAASDEALAALGSARFMLAARDADLGPGGVPGAFSCTAGVAIGDANTPAIAHLLRRATADFGSSTSGVKDLYKRQRPFVINGKSTCTPDAEAVLRGNGSYPSGHSAIGYGAGLVLAAVFPDKAAALTHRGIEFGESRRWCNVHWESDVEAGRTVAAATFARLQSDPAFREDLARAQAEARTMIAADLPDPAACRAEAAAFAVD